MIWIKFGPQLENLSDIKVLNRERLYHRSMNYLPVLVIGAGPAGLSIAYELQRFGIDYLVLEASESVAKTFHDMTHQTTYGPWVNNLLRGTTWDVWGRFYRLLARTTRSEYAEYLEQYAQRLQLKVQLNTPVESVARTDGTYRVQTAEGVYQAAAIVNCAGYFATPYRPCYPGSETTRIPQIHTSTYRSPASVGKLIGDRGRVLIVGKKLSAGETLSELSAAGFETAISTRSPIEYWPDIWKETLKSPFILVDEWLRRRLELGRPEHLKPKMRFKEHGVTIHSGETPVYPEIQEIKQTSVLFQDGSEATFDLIVYGTGYQGNFSHLEGLKLPSLIRGEAPSVRQLESTELPNLFFVGLIGGSSFRSEFLRGIREDAQRVGEVIQSRARFSPIPLARCSSSPQLEACLDPALAQVR
ncbi:MAG: NAD(P)-binding domain-containing protein [Vulcanimicrobiota bacterium]